MSRMRHRSFVLALLLAAACRANTPIGAVEGDGQAGAGGAGGTGGSAGPDGALDLPPAGFDATPQDGRRPDAAPVDTAAPAADAGTVTASGLVALWKGEFNHNDSVGGYHAQPVGLPAWSDGYTGQAFFVSTERHPDLRDVFRPNNGAHHLRVPGTFPRLTTFTVDFWVQPYVFVSPDTDVTEFVFSRGSFRNWMGFQNRTGKLEVRLPDGNSMLTIRNIWRGWDWHRVSLTFDGSSYSLYVDGVREASAPGDTSMLDRDDDLLFGHPTYGFSGALDEVAIYNRALEPRELETELPDPCTGSVPGPAAGSGGLLPSCSATNCPGAHVWSHRLGGTGPDFMKDLAVDANDNVIVVGNTFAGTTAGVDQSDVFAARFRPNGQQDGTFVRGVTPFSDTAVAVASSSDGRTAMTGTFRIAEGQDHSVWGPSAGVTSGFSVLVAPLFSAGFTRTFDSTGFVSGTDIAMHATVGGLTIMGRGRPAPFDSLGIAGVAADNYAARLASDGALRASRYFPSGKDAYVAVDAQGDLYVAGSLFGSYDFGGGALTSAGQGDIYVARYTGEGFTHVWSRRYGGAGNQIPNGMVVDRAGNVYLTGCLAGPLDFGNGPLTSFDDRCDIFVAKLSPAGDPIWAKRFGGCRDDQGTGIAVDPTGNVAVMGSFSSPVNFGGGMFLAGAYFVVKFSPSGAHSWSRVLRSRSSPVAVAMDSTGAVLLSGVFASNIILGFLGPFGDGAPVLYSAGNYDGFVVKYAP
jgi:hypothetical protein